MKLTRIIAVLALIMANCGLGMAQKIAVSGVVNDSETKEPLPGATVVLLQPKDSSQVVGIATNLEGEFTLPNVKAGNYILRVSYIGYFATYRNLALKKGNKTFDAGEILLRENAKTMKEAQVVAKAAQVEMKADTFVYNSDAYRMPEGANLEELVRKLPGAEIGDDGTIKINGKTVTKIMVEGKDFFEGNNDMAMKNLPSKLIKKIKAYDKKSDYTRITGIDDGQEETVLDLSVQKGMREGWLVDTDVAYGTEDRYSAKTNIQHFDDHFQFSLMGSINNINDGGGRWGGGGGGIVTSKMAGLNVNWDNGKPDYTDGVMKMGGHIFYNHRRSSNESKSNSQTFLDNVNSTFSNNMSNSINSSANVDARYRFEWMPDSMTNIMIQPHFRHSESHGHGGSTNVTFNRDPYATYDGKTMTDPLKQYNMMENRMIRDSIAVNDNIRTNSSESHSNNVDGWMQVNRRLQKPGRNLTANFSGGYSDSDSKSFSRNTINYYQRHNDDFNYQYNVSPSKSYNYSGQLSYSEPIIGALNLQMSYRFQYRYSDNDRTMYSLDSLLSKMGGYYTAEDLYLGYLPGVDTLLLCKNWENSQYATYKEYNHEANLMFRYNVGEDRLNFGVSLQPQTTHMDYAKNRLDTTVTRHIMNWAPRIDYRKKFSTTSEVRVRYNAWMNQPSMTNLLEVTDSSDPLNISTGNSGLRSSWQNRFDAFYNNYITEKQMGWMVNLNWNQTRNSISNATIYNTETGARYSRPMNINGNWNGGGSFMFNTAIGSAKAFNMHNWMNVSYTHDVGYQNSNSDGHAWGDIFNPDGSVNMDKIFLNTVLDKAVTKRTNVNENLRFNYRSDLLEVGLNGGFNYQHARNAVQENANLDTWSFNYGGNFQINTPWSMVFSTDISEQCRRGYEDDNMNTNELIWNATISQSFLKDKAATVSVQWYDILRERSSISRWISATTRSDSWNNAIHSYLMVHFIYKLNLMGSKEARANGWGGGGGNRGGWGGGGGRGRF